MLMFNVSLWLLLSVDRHARSIRLMNFQHWCLIFLPLFSYIHPVSSLMDRGDMELTLKDYNAIEKELRNRLETKDKFDSINTKKNRLPNH